MRGKISIFLMVGFLMILFSLPEVTQAGEEKFEDLAHKIINTSINIKPGDVVVVYGGKHTISLMEALTIEAQKAGGFVWMFLNSDRVLRSYWVNMPEKFLGQEPAYLTEWLKKIDIWIGLPLAEHPKAVFGDVPEERSAKAAKAGQIIWDMINESGVRYFGISYPTKEQAAIYKIDFSTFEKMHWAAVNADYKQISEKGNKLKKMLQGAKVVKVTSSNGTNFTFSVGERPIFVDDGIITEEEAKEKLYYSRWASLPSGYVDFAPIETSVNGKVVVPKTLCNYEPLTGVSFEFKNGKLENFKAEKGAKCFEETLAPYTGPKDMFGYFSIGLNPALKVIEDGGDYRPDSAAGMVWIGIGNNESYGGNNKTQGSFDFPIVKATVEVDGKVIIKDGQLVF